METYKHIQNPWAKNAYTPARINIIDQKIEHQIIFAFQGIRSFL